MRLGGRRGGGRGEGSRVGGGRGWLAFEGGKGGMRSCFGLCTGLGCVHRLFCCARFKHSVNGVARTSEAVTSAGSGH